MLGTAHHKIREDASDRMCDTRAGTSFVFDVGNRYMCICANAEC